MKVIMVEQERRDENIQCCRVPVLLQFKQGHSLVYLEVDGLDLDLFLRAGRDEDLRITTLDTWTELRPRTISVALNLPSGFIGFCNCWVKIQAHSSTFQ